MIDLPQFLSPSTLCLVLTKFHKKCQKVRNAQTWGGGQARELGKDVAENLHSSVLRELKIIMSSIVRT